MSSVIDAETWIGRSSGGTPVGVHHLTVDALLAEMDRVGVDRACVHHVVAREHDPTTGNELLLEAVADQPRLVPVATLLPHHTGEFMHPRDYRERLFDRGVRMVRVQPAADLHSHRFPLREWAFGPALAVLEDARVPLVIDFGLFRRAEPPWDTVAAVLAEHPDLPVILPEIQARNNRSLYPLLERYPSLVVQSQGYFVHNGIEDLVTRFGPDRVVLASGFPTKSMGGALFHVERALIADSARDQILGGNLARLLRLEDAS